MYKSVLLLFALFPLFAGAVEIRGANFANWFVLGEPAVFRSAEPLPEGKELTIRIFDSAGVRLAEQRLSAADFNCSGWQWQASLPGFYEVEFFLDGQPVEESWEVVLNKPDPADKRQYKRVAEKTFHTSRHPFAIAPAKTPEPAELSPHFGASPHFSMYRKEIPLARLIGFSSIRIHALRWDNLEKEKGKIDWSRVDDFMKLARESGWRDEDIVFNIYGTPRWASTRPEADRINVFLREYITVVPKNLDDWRNFIREVMRRYPGVKRYELWNEPHLAGFSCFWADSVENFVKLLKAGYETVKEENPEAIVWLGGIGLRYLPFYDEFLKAGGGKYFDVLPLHGGWPRPEPFHELEKKHSLAPKPVVSSEWHAMLLKPKTPAYPSERQLARDMVLDFLNQIRAGVTEVDFFCLLNHYKTEKEVLPFHREHQMNTAHVSGLFRHTPYIQPRYPALAWHIFATQVKGRLTVGDGYRFGKGDHQRALRLESESGPMLLVWSTADQPLPPDPELKAAVGPATRVIDAEGRGVEGDFKLAPEVYYFFRDPDQAAVARWTNRGEVLAIQDAKFELEHKFHGVYRQGRLFDEQWKVKDPGSLSWRAVTETVVHNEAIPPGAIRARFAAGVTPEAFELLVEVEDPVHVMKATDMKVWNFDSLQFALDTAGKGVEAERLEFAAALDEDGKPVLWKLFQPDLGGDLPDRLTPGGETVRFGRCQIDRQGGKTVYRVSLDASELYPFQVTERPLIRFSLLVNNNDGKGRAAWIEWGSGIGGFKAPYRYGDLTVRPREKSFPAQKDLTEKGWKKDDYTLTVTPDSVTVRGAPTCGVRSVPYPVTAGAAYRVRFEARGRAALRLMAGGKDFPRTDLLVGSELSGEWREFSLVLRAPAGAKNVVYAFFAWKQPGCDFEIRNFKVEAE